MTVLLTLLVIGVLGLVVAVALGRIGGGLDAPASSLPPMGGLADAEQDPELTADALAALRFAPAVRGYRMDEVDEVLDRVGRELDRRDAEIERLRRDLSRAGPGQPDPGALAGGRSASDDPDDQIEEYLDRTRRLGGARALDERALDERALDERLPDQRHPDQARRVDPERHVDEARHVDQARPVDRAWVEGGRREG